MFEKVIEMIPGTRARNVALTVGGMAALLGGQKVVALSMFGRGLKGLEDCWREAHPNFNGGLKERWEEAVEFYEATHRNPTNRKLHMVGIPMIVGGAAGLLIFNPYRPLWFISASGFAAGWVLNIVGHAGYEKNAPAFADDPLSFLAGPVWDLQNMKAGKKAGRTAHASDEDGNVNVNMAAGASA